MKQSPRRLLVLPAYLGPGCLVPLLCARKDGFAQFHGRQGLLLFILELGIGWSLLAWGTVPLAGVVFRLTVLRMNVWLLLLLAFAIFCAIIGALKIQRGIKYRFPVIGKFVDRVPEFRRR